MWTNKIKINMFVYDAIRIVYILRWFSLWFFHLFFFFSVNTNLLTGSVMSHWAETEVSLTNHIHHFHSQTAAAWRTAPLSCLSNALLDIFLLLILSVGKKAMSVNQKVGHRKIHVFLLLFICEIFNIESFLCNDNIHINGATVAKIKCAVPLKHNNCS